MTISDRLRNIKQKVKEIGNGELFEEMADIFSHDNEVELNNDDKVFLKSFIGDVVSFQKKVAENSKYIRSKALKRFVISSAGLMNNMLNEVLNATLQKIKIIQDAVSELKDENSIDELEKFSDELYELDSQNLYETILEKMTEEEFQAFEKKVEEKHIQSRTTRDFLNHFMERMMGNHEECNHEEEKDYNEVINDKLEEFGITQEEFEEAKKEIKESE